MKNFSFFSFCLVVALCAIGAVDSFGQVFRLYNADASQFPKVTGYYYAKSFIGEPVANIAATDFVVTDNGKVVDPSKVSLNCSLLEFDIQSSIILLTDFTGSMNETVSGTELRKDWILNGIRKFMDSVKLADGGSIMIVPFSNSLLPNSGWQTTKDGIANWMQYYLPPFQGLTNFNPPFLEETNNVIDLMNTRPMNQQRVVIMVTDGYHEHKSTFFRDSITKKLQDANIILYVIAVQPPVTADQTLSDLYDIATRTGGRAVEVLTKADVVKQYCKVVYELQHRKNHCRLEWTSDVECGAESINHNISVIFKKDFTDTTNTSYKAPANAFAAIASDKTSLLMGSKSQGLSSTEFNLAAQGKDFQVTGYTITPNDGAITMDLTSPATITAGKSKKVTVNYAKDPAIAATEYTIQLTTTPCTMEPIKLVAPCYGTATANLAMDNTMEGVKTTKVFHKVLENTTPLTISGKVTFKGTDAAMFSLANSSPDFTLAAGESLTLDIQFIPTSAGTKNAEVDLGITNASICGNVVIPISGSADPSSVEEDLSSYNMTIASISPNPAKDKANVNIVLNEFKNVKVSLFNTLGSEVATIFSGNLEQGSHNLNFETANLPAGAYIIALQANGTRLTKSFIVTK